MNATTFRDRLRRAIQDGRTSDGEALQVARLEDLTDQVMQQATPTATQFQVRFSATPTQGYASVFVVPGSLVAFVDSNPAPVTPTEDVNDSGVFKLPAAPAEGLQVTYAWAYYQDKTLDAMIDEARAWVIAPDTSSLENVPDALVPAVVARAAAQALRGLASKCSIASARSGDSDRAFSDLAKSYSQQAADQDKSAERVRAAYYTRADSAKAPAASLSGLAVGGPITPIH